MAGPRDAKPTSPAKTTATTPSSSSLSTPAATPTTSPPRGPATGLKGATKPAATTTATTASSSTAAAPSTKPTASTSKKKAPPSQKADIAEQFAKGNVTLKQVLGLSRDQMDRMKEHAHELLHADKLVEAKAMLEGIVAFDPFDGWALVALARIALAENNTALADKLIERALVARPDDDAALALQLKRLTG